MKRLDHQATTDIKINRAPVLTLWAAVVGERLGYDHDEALTLGKAVAGLNAQSKGRRLGIFKLSDKPAAKRKRRRDEEFRLELLGRAVPVKQTEQGVRAVAGDGVISPENVETYLKCSFGEALQTVQHAMRSPAESHRADELAKMAFGLYEDFRPRIPTGVQGWGAKGQRDIELLRSLTKRE